MFKIFFNFNEISFWKVWFCERGLTLYYTPSKHLTELDLLHSPVIEHCLTREWRQEWSFWEDYSSLQCNNLQCSRQTEVLSRGPCCSNHPEASASDQPPFPFFIFSSICHFYNHNVNFIWEESATWWKCRPSTNCLEMSVTRVAHLYKILLSLNKSLLTCFLWTSPSPSCRADMACWTCWVLFKHRIQLCCCDRIVSTFRVVIFIKFLSWWR